MSFSGFESHKLPEPSRSKKYVHKSIGEKHSEMLTRFRHHADHVIPKLREEISRVRAEQSALRPSQLSCLQTRSTKEQISELDKKIRRLEAERKQYFANNAHHLFKYFNEKKTALNKSPEKNTGKQADKLAILFGSSICSILPSFITIK